MESKHHFKVTYRSRRGCGVAVLILLVVLLLFVLPEMVQRDSTESYFALLLLTLLFLIPGLLFFHVMEYEIDPYNKSLLWRKRGIFKPFSKSRIDITPYNAILLEKTWKRYYGDVYGAWLVTLVSDAGDGITENQAREILKTAGKQELIPGFYGYREAVKYAQQASKVLDIPILDPYQGENQGR